jgi:RNA polymerase sigma-70 factor (ECF subfamily)
MPTPLQDLLIRHIPDLRRFARSLERNRAGADDLVQETLERAIKKIHLYQPSGPFLGWLNTIMRNIFVDRVRRKGATVVDSLEETAHREPAQNESQSDRLLLKEIRVAVERLPIEQKQVLIMVAVEGLSYDDAARRLRVPLGTIRSRLFRARLGLQQMIDPEGLGRDRRTVRQRTADVRFEAAHRVDRVE